MRPAQSPRAGRSSRLIGFVAVSAVVAALTALLAVPAGADPVGDARARAAAIATQVNDLQNKAEVAIEHYDSLQAQLGAAVTARMLAQRDLDAARAGSAADQQVSEDRVRALYEAGGPTTLWATVLDGSNLTDALARFHDVSVVLGTDRAHLSAANDREAIAARTAVRLAASAEVVTKLQTQAAAAAAGVQQLLDAQRQALGAANAQVRRLIVQQQAAELAASAADFQQAVNDAGGNVNQDTTPPNEIAAAAIAAARTKLGDPYLWGGTGPNAYDCSGLTQFAYGVAGVQLPRVAADQWNIGRHVGLAELLPGDLLFWATDPSNPATIHHVAIYIGAGQMLAAPHTGDVVKIEPVYMSGYIGATRPYEDG
jgi:cell wall-associated NlpC family hydrolase